MTDFPLPQPAPARPARWRDRRHRGLFWTSLLVAALLIAAGGAYAYAGYRDSRGADGAVRGYLHALARGDAATALSYGDLPAGSQTFLTSAVLQKQLKIAPMRDITLGPDQSTSGGTSVPFTYTLAFARGDLHVQDSVAVHQVGGRWRLARVAVSLLVRMSNASDRATLAGAGFPEDDTLLFPGAVPVEFDSSYLQLTLATEAVQLNQGASTELFAEATPAATTLVQHQIAALLTACGHGGTSTATLSRCPVPSAAFVPGSMRGNLVSDPAQFVIVVGSSSTGTISVNGVANFDGTYRMLDFNDVARTHRGKVSVPFEAAAYPVAPLTASFTVPS